MGIVDYVIIGVLLAAVVLAIIFYLRRKKAGRGCGSGCAGCANKDGCRQGNTGQYHDGKK